MVVAPSNCSRIVVVTTVLLAKVIVSTRITFPNFSFFQIGCLQEVIIIVCYYSVGALTPLVGRQEGHPDCKKTRTRNPLRFLFERPVWDRGDFAYSCPHNCDKTTINLFYRRRADACDKTLR